MRAVCVVVGRVVPDDASLVSIGATQDELVRRLGGRAGKLDGLERGATFRTAVAVARGERFEPQEAEDADLSRRPSRGSFWTTVAAGVVPIFVIRPLGFPVAAALAFALTARAFGSRRVLLDLAVGLGLGLACWLLFSRLLGLSLPGFPPLGVS